MNALSTTYDQSYTITNPALTWSIPFSLIQTTQIPACGYTESLTSTTTLAKITPTVLGSSIDYSVQSNDVLDAGTHTVTVISTLNNSPSNTCQSTFTITMVDPCLSTVI